MKAKYPSVTALLLRLLQQRYITATYTLHCKPEHQVPGKQSRCPLTHRRVGGVFPANFHHAGEVPIISHQKLFLYRAAICPSLNWDFMVMTSSLEATPTRFLKKWVGPADPIRLYLLNAEGGLGVPAIRAVYKRQQAPVSSLLLTFFRPCGTIHYLGRPSHREVRERWQDDPGANKRSLLKRAKAPVAADDVERRQEYARSL